MSGEVRRSCVGAIIALAVFFIAWAIGPGWASNGLTSVAAMILVSSAWALFPQRRRRRSVLPKTAGAYDVALHSNPNQRGRATFAVAKFLGVTNATAWRLCRGTDPVLVSGVSQAYATSFVDWLKGSGIDASVESGEH